MDKIRGDRIPVFRIISEEYKFIRLPVEECKTASMQAKPEIII